MDSSNEEFELTLLSNSSTELYPENSMSAFTTELSERISLTGKWSVALSTIIYPSAIRNVPRTNFSHITIQEESSSIFTPVGQSTFPPGLYCDVDEILEKLQDLSDPARLEWHVDEDRHLVMNFLTHSRFIFSSPEIPYMLGYDPGLNAPRSIVDKPVIGPSQGESVPLALRFENPVDITGGRNLLFIYTDIVEHQLVGNTKAALLRLLPLTQKLRNCKLRENTNVTSPSINELQFKPILTNTIPRIRIELRDEMGNMIPFMGDGRTAVTLKFKKVT